VDVRSLRRNGYPLETADVTADLPIPTILLTDALIRADAPAGARVTTAAVLRFLRLRRQPTIADLARFTRSRRSVVTANIKAAVAHELLTVESGHATKHRAAKYYPRNRYAVANIADPRAGANRFVRLKLTPTLGASHKRWILRAVYLCEQRIAGAIQLPLGIAGRLAGLTPDAEKKARQTWTATGDLVKVQSGDRYHPPTFVLCNEEHPPELERFKPDKRRLRTLALPSGRLVPVWGTRSQHRATTRLVTDRLADDADDLDAALARAVPGARAGLDAREVTALVGALPRAAVGDVPF
jgi:hypothetical protein